MPNGWQSDVTPKKKMLAPKSLLLLPVRLKSRVPHTQWPTNGRLRQLPILIRAPLNIPRAEEPRPVLRMLTNPVPDHVVPRGTHPRGRDRQSPRPPSLPATPIRNRLRFNPINTKLLMAIIFLIQRGTFLV